MLAIAEHSLRAELVANRLLKKMEKASGAFAKDIDLLDRHQGGFASGRMETDEEQQETMSVGDRREVRRKCNLFTIHYRFTLRPATRLRKLFI
jgi:hypothetical protein